MPGDISKRTKCLIDKPYPEPKIICKNAYYANILLQDYAGAVSELTAITLYSYQHIVGEGKYKDYAELIGGISIVEMKHLELLGETIKLLGIKPAFIDSACYNGKLWTASYVNYTTDIKEMILSDIRAEADAIKNYQEHIELIEDKYIDKLLARIIEDEKLHLRLFEKIYGKYAKC